MNKITQRLIKEINQIYGKNPRKDTEGLYNEILDTFKQINVGSLEYDSFVIPNYEIFISDRIRVLRIEIGIKTTAIDIPQNGYSTNTVGLGGQTTATLVDMGQYNNNNKNQPYCILTFNDPRYGGITGNMLHYDELLEIKKKLPAILKIIKDEITDANRWNRESDIRKRIDELTFKPGLQYNSDYWDSKVCSWHERYRNDLTEEEKKELAALKKEVDDHYKALNEKHKEKVAAFKKAHPNTA